MAVPRWLGALLLWMAATVPAWAAQRALLVGVSELVNQPQALWLQAPRNDVMLMRTALQKHGFAASDITTLADGVNGAALPDAQGIQDALGRLLEQSKSGDFVLLYFSGHGTRLRDNSKRYQEPDGLTENFLARDVRGAVGTDTALAGGLRDVDFDAWVQAFLARNVFVWSVFDTCSATSMTRGPVNLPAADDPGPDEVRWRGVRPAQLRNVPGAAPAPLSTAVPPASPAMARARYVAFFASESHQVTPELRLPRKSRGAQPQGLLTWAVAEALERRPATWRELFDGVLTLYPPVVEELAKRFPTRELPSPVAEGNLDAALFANSPRALSTRPVWRAQRAGGILTVAAGQLDGLVARQSVRVTATLEDGAVRHAAAPLSQLALGSAQVALPEGLRELSGAAFWSVSPMDEPASLALRVFAEGGLPAGLSLEYPASIVRVEAASQADLLADAGISRRRLETMARLKWFTRLQALAAGAAPIDGFEAQFEVWSGSRLLRSEPAEHADAQRPALRAGERAVLRVRNTSGHSLNLVIVGVDPQGAVQPVYPGDMGETNRFEQGTREMPSAKRFELPWFDAPGSRLMVIATPATAYSAARLFGAGPTDGMPDLRVRGLLRPASERQVFAAMVRWGGDAAAAR